MAVRREDTMWDDAVLANLREIAKGDELPVADRPARIVAYALQLAGMLPAPANTEAAQQGA